MAVLTLTQFQNLADSLSAQYDQLLALNAVSAAEDVRTGATANQGRVLDLPADLVERLIPGINADYNQAVNLTKNPVTVFGDAVRALNRPDVLGQPGIGAFLTAEAGVVTASFAALFALVFAGQELDPALVDDARAGAL